jgi:hypothetical protein
LDEQGLGGVGQIHKTLFGTWRSDKRKTLNTYKAYDSFPPAKKRRVAAIFGKLEVRYTRKYCYVTLNGETTRDRYDVIAEDADSIVIRSYSDEFRKKVDPILLDLMEDFFAPTLQHLHFESERGHDYYWIGIRVLVEWFKKRHPAKRSGPRMSTSRAYRM